MALKDVEELWQEHRERLLAMEKQEAFEWLSAEVRDGRMVPRQVVGIIELWALDTGTYGDNGRLAQKRKGAENGNGHKENGT